MDQYIDSLQIFQSKTKELEGGKKIFLGSERSYIEEYYAYLQINPDKNGKKKNESLKKNIIVMMGTSQAQMEEMIKDPSKIIKNIDELIKATTNYLVSDGRTLNRAISKDLNISHLEFLEYKRKVRQQVLELAALLHPGNKYKDAIQKLQAFYSDVLKGDIQDFQMILNYADKNKNESINELSKQLIESKNNILLGTSEFWQTMSNDSQNIVDIINRNKTQYQIRLSKGEFVSGSEYDEVIKNTKDFLEKLNGSDRYQLYRMAIAQEIGSLCLDSATDPHFASKLKTFAQELGLQSQYLDDLALAPIIADDKNQFISYVCSAANTSIDTYRLAIRKNEKMLSTDEIQPIQTVFDNLESSKRHLLEQKGAAAIQSTVPERAERDLIGSINHALNYAKSSVLSEEKISLSTVDLKRNQGAMKMIVKTAQNTFVSYGIMKGAKVGAKKGIQAVGVASSATPLAGNLLQKGFEAISDPAAKAIGYVGGLITFQILQKARQGDQNVKYTPEEVYKIWNDMPEGVRDNIAKLAHYYCQYIALLEQKSFVTDKEIQIARSELAKAVNTLSFSVADQKRQQAQNLDEPDRNFIDKLQSKAKDFLGMLPNDISPYDLQKNIYQSFGMMSNHAANTSDSWITKAGNWLREIGPRSKRVVDFLADGYDLTFGNIYAIGSFSPDARNVLKNENAYWDERVQHASGEKLMQLDPSTYNESLDLLKHSRNGIFIGAESSYYIGYMSHYMVGDEKLMKQMRENSIEFVENAKSQMNMLTQNLHTTLDASLRSISNCIDMTKEFIASNNGSFDYIEYENKVRIQILELVRELEKTKISLSEKKIGENFRVEPITKKMDKIDEQLSSLRDFYTKTLNGDESDFNYALMDSTLIGQNHFSLISEFNMLLKNEKLEPFMLGSIQAWDMFFDKARREQGEGQAWHVIDHVRTQIHNQSSHAGHREAQKTFNDQEQQINNKNVDQLLENTRAVLSQLKKNPEIFYIYRDYVAKQVAELTVKGSLNGYAIEQLNQFWKKDLNLPMSYQDDLYLSLYTTNQALPHFDLTLRAVTTEKMGKIRNESLSKQPILEVQESVSHASRKSSYTAQLGQILTTTDKIVTQSKDNNNQNKTVTQNNKDSTNHAIQPDYSKRSSYDRESHHTPIVRTKNEMSLVKKFKQFVMGSKKISNDSTLPNSSNMKDETKNNNKLK